MLYYLHHGTPTLNGKGSHPLLWASLLVARIKIIESGISTSIIVLKIL